MQAIYNAIENDTIDNRNQDRHSLDLISDLLRQLSDLGQSLTLAYDSGAIVLNRYNITIGRTYPQRFFNVADPANVRQRRKAFKEIFSYLAIYLDGANAQDYITAAKSENPSGWQSVDGVELPTIQWASK